MSGAKLVKRPGFLRLMNALKPRPPFQALVMSEKSRLGREQIGTAYALKQLVDAGVRVFFCLESRERTLESATDKIMASLTNFAARWNGRRPGSGPATRCVGRRPRTRRRCHGLRLPEPPTR
jgi:DNA invertase Pin-like site-specific DNA recombinase